MKSWAKGRISDGMFPIERVVTLETSDGEISYFVHVNQLNDSDMLRVHVLDQDSEHALIQFQSQDGRITAKIHNSAPSN